MEEKYDIWFSKGLSSKRLGVSVEFYEALTYINSRLGSNDPNMLKFRNGFVSIKNIGTGEVRFKTRIGISNYARPR